jgi:hypothetical protein
MTRSQRRTTLCALVAAATFASVSADAAGGYGYGYGRYPMAASPFAYVPYGAVQPYYRPAYGFMPFASGYAAYPQAFTGYYGSGTFSDGRRIPGTNYNPNQ